MADLWVDLRHDGFVSTLTIQRPDKLNALDHAVLEALGAAIEELRGRDACRAVIVTGAGKAFVAGADIAAMRGYGVAEAEAFARLGQGIFARLEALPMPVLAAVNGFALGGGCELALSCDFIHASEHAKFGQPEVKLGVLPGFGGTGRLARRVGIARARELVYTGRVIGAEEALRIGLVGAVHPADGLLPGVRAVADEIASMGPCAVSAAKRALLEGEERLLPEANAIEARAFASCFRTDDQKEGMAAFLEKRTPRFRGR